jgi:tetratricopeptide (TPR) repeat protein/tRNA A-37 threonylcarbamoyl transferase component Bud32
VNPPETEESSRDPSGAPRSHGPLYEAPVVPLLDERRFRVQGERARGGIGRILEARDTLLRRPVALKQLLASDRPEQAARFMREAVITARLQHPAIVPVYDAGMRTNGEPYYAMPLLPGQNLHQVIAGAPTLRERLALLPHVQAVADAIAYAHDQRVVHRDLKPANVLVGRFAETVVIDWGLAKDLDDQDDHSAAPLLDDTVSFAVETTQTGVPRGTPAYMAPEQARGEAIDARADVYALGAMLYHLLTGRPPHDRTHPASAGPPPPLESLEPRVPRDLTSIVEKAMAAASGDRYPSARLLAEDLRRFATGQLVGARRYRPWTLLRRFARRHRITLLAAVAVAAVTLAVAVPIAHRAGAVPPCGGDEGLVAAVWNPARASAIRQHFGEVAGAAGTAQWDRALPVFDAYAARWAHERRESCEATRVRHVQSDSVYDRRLYCFDRRRTQLDGIATMLGRVDTVKVALDVTNLAAELPRIEDCTSPSLINDAWMPPLEKRAAVRQAYRALDQARALTRQGHYAEAMPAYLSLEPAVLVLGYPVLDAELHMEMSFAAEYVDDFVTARRVNTRLKSVAAALGRIDWLIEAELELFSIDQSEDHFDAAEARVPMLEDLVRLSPSRDSAVLFHWYLSLLYSSQGRFDEAVEESRLEIAAMPADGSYRYEAQGRKALGRQLWLAGRYDEAEAELRRALAVNERRNGPDHPGAASTYTELGNLENARERYAEALAHLQHARALYQKAAGDKEDANVRRLTGIIGTAQIMSGDAEAGLASLEQALAALHNSSPASRAVIYLRQQQVDALLALGRDEEAESLMLDVVAKVLPESSGAHALLPSIHAQLAEVRLVRHDAAGAVRACEEALGIMGKAPEEPDMAWGILFLRRAQAYAVLGRAREAHAEAARALGILSRVHDHEAAHLVIEAGLVLAELALADGHADQALAFLAPLPGSGRLLLYGQLAFVRARALAAHGSVDEGVAVARRALPALEVGKDRRVRRLAGEMQAWLAKN